MKIRRFTKSALALLLVLASLVSMLPLAFAAETEDREKITINSSDLLPTAEGEMDRETYEAMEEDLQNQMAQQLAEEYGLVMDEPEVTSKNDEDTEFGYLTYDELVAAGLNPEDFGYKGATRDVINATTPAYIFLDFKVGSASRTFNWQYKSDDGTVPYHSANIQGAIAADYKGTDPRLYLPIETDADYIDARLKGYKIKSGDIARVYINAINENTQFVANGTKTADSYFAVHTSDSPGEWVGFASAHAKITFKSGSQTLTWNVSNSRVGDTLYAIRWDPSQTELTDSARIYVDYIYIGPSATAPVLCQFRNEANDANLSGGGGYVAYGKKAPAFSTGKVNSEDSTTQTIWGWTVWHQINGTWTNQNKFVTDPATVTLNYNTRFVLTQVKIRKQTLNSTQTYTNGASTEDDKYVLTVDGFDTAELNLGGYGTPLDVAILLDRSGSEGELVWTKNFSKDKEASLTTYLETLSKHVDDGYYRATCFRKNKHNGTANAFTGGYVFTMPMRYHNGDWQMQYIMDCNCNGGYYADYGIYKWNSTGLTQCKHVKWVTVEEGYKKFIADAATTGYTVGKEYTIQGVKETLYFALGASRMGKMQGAIEKFLIKLYNSTTNLKPGVSHRVSVISYGVTVYAEGYPYDTTDGYSTTNNFADASCSVQTLSYSTYETVLKAINQTYILGCTRTDCAFQVLSGTVSAIEKAAGKTSPVLKSTNYLPAPATGRKRVVILLTDGKPSESYDFTASVANAAVKASALLKDDANTKVYCIGVMDGLNSNKTAIYNDSNETHKANDFLNAVSSRYRNAQVWNTGGTLADLSKGDYYFSDTAGGGEIATQMESIWNDNAASLKISGKSGPASLWLYEDYGREWKPDSDPNAKVKIYAAPYTGNGTYGARVLIGEHQVADHTKNQDFTGNGYILHYYYDSADQSFTYALQWTDAKTAFLRETKLSTGSKAKGISGSLDTTKGYKVYMEMPIEVDRNNTLGGNNIPLTTSTSGCYQAKDASDTAIGTKLYNYVQPNANVYCSVESEAHDYFISLDEYIGLLAGTSGKTAENVLNDMLRMPENLKPANDFGVSNLKYLSFDVKIQDPKNTVIYHKAAAQNATSLSTNVYEMDQLSADMTKDQKFTMTAKMTYATHNTDSYGRAPYQDVNNTFYPTYYVPKFAVVDYGDNISVPMGLEGEKYAADSSKITGLSGGTLTVANNAAAMKLSYNGKFYNTAGKVASYTYVTENIPKGATSKNIAREVTLIPANVVTYDDNVITFGSGWTTSGTTTAIEQTYNNTAIYGHDTKYDTTGNFHGSVKVATVDATNSTKQGQFTFTGTGFEIISRTTKDSGVLLAEVYSGSTIKEDGSNLLKSILCNTYLATADYNQVPVIRWDCTTQKDTNQTATAVYGTYTVRLTAYYNIAFALRGTKNALSEEDVKAMLGYGKNVDFTYIPSDSVEETRGIATSYNVYVDGIRIFNPVEGSDLVNNVYSLAGEIVDANFVDMQSVALRDTSNWDGNDNKVNGMLYLADKSANADGDDTTNTAADGFPLFMNGKLSLDPVTVTGATGKTEKRTYYLNDAGKRYKDPATGQEIWSMAGEKGGYYYYIVNPKATASKPYATLSREYVRQILGDDGVFYSSKYRALGAKTEIQLKSGSGVAFNVTGGKVMVSIKSANGGKVTLQAHNGSDFVNVAANVTSATESFYDLTSYVKNGGLILKNSGSGILSIVHVKTGNAAQPVSVASVYVDDELAYKAAKLFETPIDEEIQIDSLKIGHSVNLQSNIGINYVVSKSALEAYDHYVFTAEVNGKTYYPAPVEKGNYLYFTLDCLTAAMMNDNVRAQITASIGEEIYVSPVDDYSIAVYAYTMMNKEGVSDSVKRLCANLLRYGAMTQTYLGYNVDALADEEMTDEHRTYLCDLDSITFGNCYEIGTDVADASVTWAGRTLALDSTVAVKFVVNASACAGDAAELELRGTYMGVDGEAKTITAKAAVYNADKGLYIFTLDQLNAAELRSVLTCQVYAGDVAVSQTMSYSADTYANGKTGKLLELCKALFAYVDQANAYFAN